MKFIGLDKNPWKKSGRSWQISVDLVHKRIQTINNCTITSEHTFNYTGDTTVFNAEDITRDEQSSFAIFIADYQGGDQYRVISANDFGKSFENTILRFIGKTFPEDIAVLERGTRQQMRKIARNELLAPEVRSNFKRLANEPMKFQAPIVIDGSANTKDQGGN